MTTTFASHSPCEVIDAIRPDLEAFTSLWTALRVNYEGTNITRTVARLLHMYQPEEGIIAYERLLRTLFVLLEDFDNDGLQLLVSMVPPPKNVDDEIVKQVFNRATGFVRVDAPIFHKNTDMSMAAVSTHVFPNPKPETQSCSSTADEQSGVLFPPENISSVDIKKNPDPIVQIDNNGPQNRMQKSPQIISQESSEVFRGFPPSEIFNTQSHVQSIKNFYRPSTSYGFPQSRGAGQSFINFGQIVGQNSGQIQQQITSSSGLVGAATAASYRPKWFQSPYLIQKNSYTPGAVTAAAQYQDFYLKTVNNQYVKVPAAKINNFHQASVNSSQGSYQQTLYNNSHDYLRNRSNTVTSGLLEKIQRHRSLQEAAIKKILTECDPSKNSTVLNSVEQVSDGGITPSSLGNVPEFKIVDLNIDPGDQEQNISGNLGLKNSNIGGNSRTRNLLMKTCNLREKCIINSSGNDKSILMRNFEDKIAVADGTELDFSGKNNPLDSETFEEFTKEVRMRQRAIQEDIFKMDVVRNEISDDRDPGNKEEADNSIKPEILTSSEELKNSCKKFIDRIKKEEIIEVPIFPKTRSLDEIHEHSGVLNPSESNLWRLLTSKNVSENETVKVIQSGEMPDEEFQGSSSVEKETSVSPVEITAIMNKGSISVPKRAIRKKKTEVSSTTRGKSQRVVQKGPIISQVMNFQDDNLNPIDRENYTGGSAAEQDVQRMQNNSQMETTSRCQSSIAPQINSSSISPATTMAELAAYKKQYYDALLSIQKAKAAVANSLAISSMGSSSPSFDPYYYNYLQQQHHQSILQRRQHQILMGQRFSQQQSLPATNAGTPTWFRNPANWRYPVITPSRLPQRPQMLHPSSPMWRPGVGYLGRDSRNNITAPLRQQLNVVQVHAKPPVKRRKLEEIVGKLKETENNVSND